MLGSLRNFSNFRNAPSLYLVLRRVRASVVSSRIVVRALPESAPVPVDQ